MEVTLSEDATAIIAKLEYDVTLNSIIGFSLPLGTNGLPDASDAVVLGAEQIINKINIFEKATVAFVVMAQPLSDHVPPKRICSFGSNNRFTTINVHNPLSSIVKALHEIGVRVLNYSADADSRELKMMRDILKLGAKTTSNGKLPLNILFCIHYIV